MKSEREKKEGEKITNVKRDENWRIKEPADMQKFRGIVASEKEFENLHLPIEFMWWVV